MKNFGKIRSRLDSICKALGNVESGRMPLSHLEEVFDTNIEYIRSLIDSERFNAEEKETDMASTDVS